MQCRLDIKVGGIALSLVLAILSLTSCQHTVTKVAAGPPPPSPASVPPAPQPIVVPAAPVKTDTPAKSEAPINVTPPTVAPPAPTPETKDVPPVPEKTTTSKPANHVAPKPPTPTPT